MLKEFAEDCRRTIAEIREMPLAAYGLIIVVIILLARLFIGG